MITSTFLECSILSCICLFCFLFVNYVSFQHLTSTQIPKKYHAQENRKEISNKIINHETNHSNDLIDHDESESSRQENETTDKITCHFPHLQPFDKDILKFFANPLPKRGDCQKDHPLIFKSDLNGTIIKVQDPIEFNYKKCCYIPFQHREKSKAENKIRYLSGCRLLTKEKTQVIPADAEFVQIVCYKDEKIVTIDYFGFTPSSKVKFAAKVNSKKYVYEEDEEAAKKNEPRKVNVVVLGMDSTSHMNFRRVMPMTFDYLTRNLSAVGMNGYTKVGDNSYPNIVAMLMGRNETEVRKMCRYTSYHYFDSCPLIWRKYQAEGYMTAYGEDSIELGNFKYLNRGFKSPPVDFYYNTLMTQMNSVIGHGNYVNTNWCLGPRLGFEVLLDFMKKMAFSMQKTHRYFQFIWACSLFHDDVSGGILGDKMLLESIQWLQHGGYLNDTVLIFASDHGSRWADLRNTPRGKIEDRMPLLYFTFPSWFRQKYGKALSNLKRNSKRRLTTHFDLHETLVDLLHLQNITNERLEQVQTESKMSTMDKKSRPRSRGISLFHPIPTDRNCEDAGISEHFCVCSEMKEILVKGNSLVKEAAENVVRFINQLFLSFPQCKNLSLSNVNSAQVLGSKSKLKLKNGEIMSSLNSQADRSKNESVEPMTLSITLSVSPSDAKFEATVTRETSGNWTTSREISRTNLYGNQSWCVDDYKMKKFCFC